MPSRLLVYALIAVGVLFRTLGWGYMKMVGDLILMLLLLGMSYGLVSAIHKGLAANEAPATLGLKGVLALVSAALAILLFLVPALGADAWFTRAPTGFDRDAARNRLVGIVDLAAPGAEALDALSGGIGNRRIVALGESHHLTSEFSRIKVPIIRHLHETMGFDVLLFETPTAPLRNALRAMAVDREAATGMRGLFAIWQTTDVLPLFEYILETWSTPRPLLLAGFDPQHFEQHWEDARRLLDDVLPEVDPDLAQEELRHSEMWASILAEREQCDPSDDRVVAGAAHYRRLAETLGAWADACTADRPARRLDLRLAAFVAEGLAVSLELQTLQGAELSQARDRCMAEFVVRLAESEFPNNRILLWAHNAHLWKRPRHLEPLQPDLDRPRSLWNPDRAASLNMGLLLSERYPDDLYVLGLLARRGRMGEFARLFTWMPVRRPRRDAVESILALERSPAVYLDLADDGLSVLGEPLYFRTHGLVWRKAVLPEQFDGLIVVDEVTPPDRTSWRRRRGAE